MWLPTLKTDPQTGLMLVRLKWCDDQAGNSLYLQDSPKSLPGLDLCPRGGSTAGILSGCSQEPKLYTASTSCPRASDHMEYFSAQITLPPLLLTSSCLSERQISLVTLSAAHGLSLL